MDMKVAYSTAIRSILNRAAKPFDRSEKPDVETLLLADEVQGHYQLLRLGWFQGRRVRSILFHIRLLNGKIRIEEDNTDYPLVDELVAAGVDRSDIEYATPPHYASRQIEAAVA